MVDAESADLVHIDQYLTKCRNCLGLNRWENCFGRFDFSVSTFQCFKVSGLPIENTHLRAVFQTLHGRGSFDLEKNDFFFKFTENIFLQNCPLFVVIGLADFRFENKTRSN